MEITVTFRHMEPSESLKAYAEEKISKIKKYLYSPMEAHVVLGVEKFRHMADVTLRVDGAMIKGAEETEDMYSAIDQVMDKIEKQVKKYRSKIRERGPENIKGGETLESEATLEPGEGLEEPVIEVEKLVAKPMDPEEAAMQFSLSDQEFMVFRNSRSQEINVIYRRKNGNLGLIEPSS
ncbi:MAG: ribosome-associated translation inhibitor RaiA [Deltaproteobacteria bacterium]|nr:ribosome-associated translation inhibitor RaiA [Deltaproteobacteria bacterium]MBW2016385.1 ribosome-associated translation inhibitor RaiA [Deltaproteobacteria bacterium]MBW2129715.1 ribosome-associated translation inhibitor RaiA [Deltaproteobacteria bacterium]MBW2304926.1 ribosome-associated translation inhibitor RaiA [Deltaproteobacteria bacterium]